MNRTVYYLSFHSQQGGFLFPDELPPNYYSPGLFLIEPERNGDYPCAYTFHAMDNGTRVSLKLIRAAEDNPRSLSDFPSLPRVGGIRDNRGSATESPSL